MRKKITAAALAVIIPGLGHIHAGRNDRGLVIMFITLVLAPLGLFLLGAGEDDAGMQLPHPLVAGFWISCAMLYLWQACDAFRSTES